MALKLIKPGTGVFLVRGQRIAPVNATTWVYWASGRIYPPAGTYWVEATPGTNVEKRGTETVKLTTQQVVSFADGDHLLVQFMQDGQAIRVTPT